MPEVENTETSEASLIDVDGPHVETVPAGFLDQQIKTETQASQHEREEQDRQPTRQSNKSSQSKSQSSQSSPTLRANTDNPIVIGNVVVAAALTGVLGWNGWRWWQNGAKGGAGVVAGAMAFVGLFGAGDYFLTRWALAKYPQKN